MTYSGGGLPLARHGNSTGSPPLTKYFTPAGGPFTIDGGACPAWSMPILQYIT